MHQSPFVCARKRFSQKVFASRQARSHSGSVVMKLAGGESCSPWDHSHLHRCAPGIVALVWRAVEKSIGRGKGKENCVSTENRIIARATRVDDFSIECTASGEFVVVWKATRSDPCRHNWRALLLQAVSLNAVNNYIADTSAAIPVWPVGYIYWDHIVAYRSLFFFCRNSSTAITAVPILRHWAVTILRNVANCSLFIELLGWGGSSLARQMASAGASERSPAGPPRMQPARLRSSAECISATWKIVIPFRETYYTLVLQLSDCRKISAFEEKIIQTWSSRALLRCSIVQRRRRTEKWSFWPFREKV